MVTIPKMNSYKLTILATLIIAATTVVAASPVETNVFPEESSVRIDSFTSYEMTIENVGPVEDTYTFTSSSTPEIDIAPQKINLQPNQQETVNIWYNPNTDREEGTYDFTITATSQATGDKYSNQITATVIRERDVNLEFSETSKTACRGETSTYQIDVTNAGIQKEEFQLSTDYGQLSTQQVTLEDGETQTVTLTANSDTVTTENFNVRATSTTSYAQDIKNIQFNVENCFSSETSVTPTNQETAAGTTTDFDVTIRNTGTRQDEFTLSSNTGQFTENPVEIDGKSSETVQLEVTPTQLGTQAINIRAEGSSTSTTSAQLQVYNGNNMDISFEQPEYRTCETDKPQLETTITNTGETTETYTLETNRGLLETDEIEIPVGETETILTQIDATKLETSQSYEVTTTATASTFGQPSKTATSTVLVENCFDVQINTVPEVASAGENRSTIYEINIENTGTRENTYNLTAEGPDWISIRPEAITVQPGQTQKAYMYAGIPYQKKGNVKITATATGNNATDSQTVELVIGEDVEQAINSSQGQGITGQFTQNLTSSGTAIRLSIAIILALAITAIILAREW